MVVDRDAAYSAAIAADALDPERIPGLAGTDARLRVVNLQEDGTIHVPEGSGWVPTRIEVAEVHDADPFVQILIELSVAGETAGQSMIELDHPDLGTIAVFAVAAPPVEGRGRLGISVTQSR